VFEGKLSGMWTRNVGQRMPYQQHRHDGVIKPGEQFDPAGKAAPKLHELLERKGFSFQLGPDYCSFGRDEDWQDKPIGSRPLISVYQSGTWDGIPVPGYPMKPETELTDYLNSLPDVPLP